MPVGCVVSAGGGSRDAPPPPPKCVCGGRSAASPSLNDKQRLALLATVCAAGWPMGRQCGAKRAGVRHAPVIGVQPIGRNEGATNHMRTSKAPNEAWGNFTSAVQCVLVTRESFTKEYGSRVFHSSPCGPLFLHIEPNQLSLITRTHCTHSIRNCKGPSWIRGPLHRLARFAESSTFGFARPASSSRSFSLASTLCLPPYFTC